MKPLAQINVVPFIDVMLVLLAIVLTTATFVAQGKIPVDIPSAKQAEPMSFASSIEIAIDDRGHVFMDGKELELDGLRDECGKLSSDTPLVLRVASQAAFEHFVAVIDVLKGHHLENLSILTRRDQG